MYLLHPLFEAIEGRGSIFKGHRWILVIRSVKEQICAEELLLSGSKLLTQNPSLLKAIRQHRESNHVQSFPLPISFIKPKMAKEKKLLSYYREFEMKFDPIDANS